MLYCKELEIIEAENDCSVTDIDRVRLEFKLRVVCVEKLSRTQASFGLDKLLY